MQGETVDWSKADKKQLLAALDAAMKNTAKLSDTIARLMSRPAHTTGFKPTTHREDFVPAGWAERYGITIPRADGYFESDQAWVRIVHGVITNAGLKNQSILSRMVCRELLDSGAEHHASIYSDWRAAFFARVEAARYSDHGCGDPEAWSKEDRFSKLLQAVERKELRYVDCMVTSRPKEKDVAAVNQEPETFIRAFEAMARAVSRINRDADDALKAKRSAVNAQDNACV